jgi:putative ATP-dependent endonuclease of the OLD family
MHIASVPVENFKGIRELTTSLGAHTCVIGENNAGKSSLLQALLIFLKGQKLGTDYFYNPSEPIRIEARLEGIDDAALTRLSDPDNRERTKSVVREGKLTLIRRMNPDKQSTYTCLRPQPKDERLREQRIADLVSGKSKGDIASALVTEFPDIATAHDGFKSLTTQKAAKEFFENIRAGLGADDLVEVEGPLPTGIPESIAELLPEPLYIPAVKDFADDLKTKDGATFGKLLAAVFRVIEPHLSKESEVFAELDKKLNAPASPDAADIRLDEIKDIERLVQGYVRETFGSASIALRFNPPDIKSILSGADIQANDGVEGPLDHKGDGFKRAVIFSLLRSATDVARKYSTKKPEAETSGSEEPIPVKAQRGYLFLFEEPELYLHPRNQRVLYEALADIASQPGSQVVVTTHSPFFFDADRTNVFVKMAKMPSSPPDAPKPYGKGFPIDLRPVPDRDAFQFVSFESSNAAFFARKILIVEGDSDLILAPHFAGLLKPAWKFLNAGVMILKAQGKGSFKRYREFFSRFDVPVELLTDLDALVQGFQKLTDDANLGTLRSNLIQAAKDELAASANPDASGEEQERALKKAAEKGEYRALIRRVIELRRVDPVDSAALADALQAVLEFETAHKVGEVLKSSTSAVVNKLKAELLERLRHSGIYVLGRGELEDYYPDGVSRAKVLGALECKKHVTTQAEVRKLTGPCSESQCTWLSEFDAIFARVFRPADAAPDAETES